MQRPADRKRATWILFAALSTVCALLLAAPVASQVGGSAAQGEETIVDEEPPPEEEPADEAPEEEPEAAEEDVVRRGLAPAKSEGVEEIKVTTTMSELTARDQAVSVTQFTAADIADFRIQNISDLSNYTPNLEINTAFAASNPTIFIRGIGLKDYNANSAGSVAVYTDGIYVNSPAGQLFQLFDIANVEVLRGPQGSQSARNATAGAIKVYSNKPDGEFSGTATMSYGRYNLTEFEAAVGFPVFGDIVSGRVSGAANFMDGYTKNLCANAPTELQANQAFRCDRLSSLYVLPGGSPDVFPIGILGDFEGLKDKLNNTKDWALRGLLSIKPRDTVDLLVNVHWGQNRSDSRHLQSLSTRRNPPGSNVVEWGEDVDPNFNQDPLEGFYEQDGKEFLDLLGGSLTANVDFGFVQLTSITGIETNERLVQDEGDASPQQLLGADWSDETWQATQELRVEADGENYNWAVGGYFIYEEVDSDNLFKSSRLSFTRQNFSQSLLSFAPYAHGTWEFDEFWSVELGARYNWDRKLFELGTVTEIWQRIVDPSSPAGFRSGWNDCCALDRIALALPTIATRGVWAAPTGDFTINFEPIEDVKFYVKYARGMKSGHFNASSFTDDQSLDPVEPEFVHSGEFGIKSVWLDGAFRIDAAVFYYDYKDLQVFDIANEVGRPPVQQLLNADATNLGVEAEIEMRPHPDISAQLGFSWLDATFKEFRVRKQTRPPFKGTGGLSEIFDFTGNPLIAAPRFTLTGNIEYNRTLGRFGTLTPGFDFSYKTKTSLDPGNRIELTQPAYWLLNARLRYTTPDERIHLSGWVRNLTEKFYLVDAFDQSIDTNEILYVYSEPRIYGVTLSLDW